MRYMLTVGCFLNHSPRKLFPQQLDVFLGGITASMDTTFWYKEVCGHFSMNRPFHNFKVTCWIFCAHISHNEDKNETTHLVPGLGGILEHQ